MTVKELIEFLQTKDENLIVAYEKYSEAQLLDVNEIKTADMQPARPDGWIHFPWRGEPKLPTVKYLLFPGN